MQLALEEMLWIFGKLSITSGQIVQKSPDSEAENIIKAESTILKPAKICAKPENFKYSELPNGNRNEGSLPWNLKASVDNDKAKARGRSMLWKRRWGWFQCFGTEKKDFEILKVWKLDLANAHWSKDCFKDYLPFREINMVEGDRDIGAQINY